MKGQMQHMPLVVTHCLDYAARWHSEQQVVTCTVEGPTVTFTVAELHKRSQLCALALRSLGVRGGSMVATMAWNTHRHIEAWYGIMGLGAVCHTLNPRLFARELEYIINHAEDTFILVDITFVKLLEQLQPKLPTVKGFIIMTDEAHMPKDTILRGVQCFEALLQAQMPNLPFQWLVTDEETACGLCYTSGTTGNPKGVMYSHRSNYLHALMTTMPDVLNLRCSSCCLVVVPMFHANAWGFVFSPFMVGAKVVLPGPNTDGDKLYDAMDTHRVTVAAGVPTLWMNLLDHINANKLQLPHLEILVVGGAAAPPTMIEAFEKRYGVECRHMWGMTETSPLGSLGTLKLGAQALPERERFALKCKQGRGHPFLDLRIVGEDGRELPWDGNSIGDLHARGPICVDQYFKLEGSRTVDAEKWFATGDVATIDHWGTMQIMDRSKDVIKSGGEWISSIEIENVAVAHPKVAVAAVIAVPDRKWTERPLLVVVAVKGQTASKDDVLEFLKGKIAKWWMPNDVVFVDSIPMTATGKISKKMLREQLKDYKPPSSKL